MDKVFREKLKNFAEEPPAFVWDNIQEQLNVGRRKKRIAWYGWAAAAALLALAFIAGWQINESSEKNTRRVAEKQIVRPESEKIAREKDSSTQPPRKDEPKTTKKETGLFLAGSDDNRTDATKPEEKITVTATEEEGALLASADLIFMERLKPVEANLNTQKEASALAKKSVPQYAVGLTSYEREVINENAGRLNRMQENQAGWKMGVNVSPGYSSYSANHRAAYANNMTYEASDGNGNLSGGVSVQYKTGKRWSVESGVYYAQNGQQTGSSPEMFGGYAQADRMAASPTEGLYFNTAVEVDGNRMAMNSTAGVIDFEGIPKGAEIAANLETTGTYSNSLLTQGELSQVFDFVEIPLYLRYLLLDSKIDLELVGGVNAGLVVGNNAYIDNDYGVQNIGKTRDISTVNISGTVGVGLTYALGKHISLAVEPRLNYYLNSINRNPDVDFRPYRVGVYTGLYYEF